MHVCLMCIEFFGDSIYGGFGRSTRFIGRDLARRGVQVSVVVFVAVFYFHDSLRSYNVAKLFKFTS